MKLTYSVLNIVSNLSTNKKGAKFQISVGMSKILSVIYIQMGLWVLFWEDTLYLVKTKIISLEKYFVKVIRVLNTVWKIQDFSTLWGSSLLILRKNSGSYDKVKPMYVWVRLNQAYKIDKIFLSVDKQLEM